MSRIKKPMRLAGCYSENCRDESCFHRGVLGGVLVYFYLLSMRARRFVLAMRTLVGTFGTIKMAARGVGRN